MDEISSLIAYIFRCNFRRVPRSSFLDLLAVSDPHLGAIYISSELERRWRTWNWKVNLLSKEFLYSRLNIINTVSWGTTFPLLKNLRYGKEQNLGQEKTLKWTISLGSTKLSLNLVLRIYFKLTEDICFLDYLGQLFCALPWRNP